MVYSLCSDSEECKQTETDRQASLILRKQTADSVCVCVCVSDNVSDNRAPFFWPTHSLNSLNEDRCDLIWIKPSELQIQINPKRQNTFVHVKLSARVLWCTLVRKHTCVSINVCSTQNSLSMILSLFHNNTVKNLVFMNTIKRKRNLQKIMT